MKDLVKTSLITSLAIQWITLFINLFGLFQPLPAKDFILKEILGLESIVQAIELIFYTWYQNHIEAKISDVTCSVCHCVFESRLPGRASALARCASVRVSSVTSICGFRRPTAAGPALSFTLTSPPLRRAPVCVPPCSRVCAQLGAQAPPHFRVQGG